MNQIIMSDNKQEDIIMYETNHLISPRAYLEKIINIDINNKSL